MSAKYPDVTVQLTGEDGNGFVIAARVRKAMKRAGLEDEGKEFFDAAMASKSYDDLLSLVLATVEVG